MGSCPLVAIAVGGIALTDCIPAATSTLKSYVSSSVPRLEAKKTSVAISPGKTERGGGAISSIARCRANPREEKQTDNSRQMRRAASAWLRFMIRFDLIAYAFFSWVL
jgi:hypothetical protein